MVDSAPAELRLWFSEAPEPVFSEVRLLNTSGQPVQGLGALRRDPSDPTLLHMPLGPLQDGVYTVAWRATSAGDGHVTSGSFAFVLGQGQVSAGGPRSAVTGPASSEAPSPLELLVRWLGYLGMALLTGGFAFFLLVLGPALPGGHSTLRVQPSPGPSAAQIGAGAGEEAAGSGFEPDVLLTLLVAGWVLTVLSTLAGSVFEAANGAGVAPFAAIGVPLEKLLGGTRYGSVFWIRVLSLGVLGILLVHRLLKVPGKGSGVAWWMGGLAASAIVLITTSLNSHAGAAPSVPISVLIMVLADWLHLSAAAIWVGGLICLALVLGRAKPSTERKSDIHMGELVTYFSLVATFCIIVIALTGVSRMIRETNGPADLLDTPWGNALLAKVFLMAPLLCLGFVNHFFITGRLNQTEGHGGVAVGTWRKMLLWTVGGEILLASVLLGSASVLVALPPAVGAYGSGVQLRAGGGDLNAVLVVNPSRPGPNSFDIYLRDKFHRPAANAEKVALIFSSVEQDTGFTEAVAANLGEGHYLVRGSYVSLVATWHIQLLVRQAGLEDQRLDFLVVPSQLTEDSAGGHVHH